MKARFTANVVLGKILLAASVIKSKNVIPILSCLQFKIANAKGGCRAVASDGETFISVEVPMEVLDEDKVSFCVESQDMLNCLRNLGDSTVEMSMSKDFTSLSFNYESGRFKIPCHPADEYPKPKCDMDDASRLEIGGGVLANALHSSIIAVCNDELRPMMNGINIAYGKKKVEFAASNSKILVYVSCQQEDNKQAEGSFTLPSKAAKSLISILKTSDCPVSIGHDSKKAIISAESFTMAVSLCEGKFPNYKAVIPSQEKNSVHVTVSKDELLQTLRRVLPMSSDTSRVTFSFLPDKICVDAEDVDMGMKASETLPCTSNEGTGVNICFNGYLLADLIKNIDDELILFEIENEKKSVIVRAAEAVSRDSYLSLIMPMAK